MNFACPSCGFRVFNRRYSKCERCGKDLPQSLLLSEDEVKRLDRDAQEARLRREALMKSMGEKRAPSEAVWASYGDGSLQSDWNGDSSSSCGSEGLADCGGAHGGH